MDPFADDLVPAPWPSLDADLRSGDSDWRLVACMDWPRDQWIGYVTGYWNAANLIVTQVAATGRDQDYLVYPFLMCWRHYVELQLKNLLVLLQRYRREPAEFLRTHRLDLLWQQTRKPLQEAFPGEDDVATFANAERVILQLQGFDPTSEHFRYPVLKDGSKTLPTLGRVHMGRFHEAMEGVAHFLDATDSGLREMINTRDEIESEMYYR